MAPGEAEVMERLKAFNPYLHFVLDEVPEWVQVRCLACCDGTFADRTAKRKLKQIEAEVRAQNIAPPPVKLGEWPDLMRRLAEKYPGLSRHWAWIPEKTQGLAKRDFVEGKFVNDRDGWRLYENYVVFRNEGKLPDGHWERYELFKELERRATPKHA